MAEALIHKLELYLGISLLLSFSSFGKRILFPFQLFTTWVHECWHALTALLLGGGGITITLAPDGSGLTRFSIPKGRVRQSLVASAGYLGASVSGCFLFYLSMGGAISQFQPSAHHLLLGLTILIVLSLVFWIRNGFGVASVAILAAALGALIYSPWQHYTRDLLIFLSMQTALNALFDIRQLYSAGAASDAHTMKKCFFLPVVFWASLWLGVSVYAIYFTLRCLRLLA